MFLNILSNHINKYIEKIESVGVSSWFLLCIFFFDFFECIDSSAILHMTDRHNTVEPFDDMTTDSSGNTGKGTPHEIPPLLPSPLLLFCGKKSKNVNNSYHLVSCWELYMYKSQI